LAMINVAILYVLREERGPSYQEWWC
jgi:hypothetical protein